MATEIRALIDEGAARLARVADDPRVEAEILLAAALARPRSHLAAHADDQVLDCEATDRYEAYVTRRALGEPVAYILGEKEFWSLPLAVTPGRADSAARNRTAGRARARAPAAGRGCGRAGPRDRQRRDRARDRKRAPGLPRDRDRHLVRTQSTSPGRTRDDCASVASSSWPVRGTNPWRDGAFDLISSNPPYIANGDPRVERSVQRFEPHAALYAGPTGLEAFSKIIEGALQHLKPDGWLVLEHGDTQGEAVRRLLSLAGFDSACARIAILRAATAAPKARWTHRPAQVDGWVGGCDRTARPPQ